MRSFTATGEKAIGTTGFLLFGAFTLIMAILKATVITDWSWWRVSLPIGIFVGFNLVYILVGFIHLSLVNIRERPPRGRDRPCRGPSPSPAHLDLAAVLRALCGQSGQMVGGCR